MSYIKNGKIWRLSPCYEAELTTLRSLVREMGLVISKLTLGKAEILNRPEVKAIMENIGPKDMPHSEDLVYPQNR
jgi:hypothetical protein